MVRDVAAQACLHPLMTIPHKVQGLFTLTAQEYCGVYMDQNSGYTSPCKGIAAHTKGLLEWALQAVGKERPFPSD